MENYVAAVWIIAGMALMGVIVWFTMPALMVIKRKSSYNYDETISALTEALKNKPDWVVKVVNDYQKSTANFAALERVGSINICNPRYASKILGNDADRGVTAFMPLAIGVYENKHGQVFVSQLNVGLMGMMFGGTIAEVMGMAGKDLGNVIQAATGKSQVLRQ
jgi:uncharacterized protein (DUF302 family)